MAIIKVSTELSTVTVLTFMLNMRASCYSVIESTTVSWRTGLLSS